MDVDSRRIKILLGLCATLFCALVGAGLSVGSADEVSLKQRLVVLFEGHIDGPLEDQIKGIRPGDLVRAARELVDDRQQSERVRGGALYTLALLSDHESLHRMSWHLFGTSVGMRKAAILALRRLGSQSSIAELRRYLPQAHNDPLVFVLLSALGKGISEESRAAIRQFSVDDQRPSVKTFCDDLLSTGKGAHP